MRRVGSDRWLARAALLVAGLGLVGAIAMRPAAGPVPSAPPASPSPTTATAASPSPTGSPAPTPTPSPTASPTLDPSLLASLRPSLRPALGAVATRVVVPDLDIDLPVIPGTAGYPPCGVALYLQHHLLGQPGDPRATYLYAHAQPGLFLPLLTASRVKDGAALKGVDVRVYTSADQVHVYEITQVRRHQTTLDDALDATTEQLWLQTSEGPRDADPKLMLVARPVAVEAAEPGEARPTPKPVACD